MAFEALFNIEPLGKNLNERFPDEIIFHVTDSLK